jgi:hypothetical protein
METSFLHGEITTRIMLLLLLSTGGKLTDNTLEKARMTTS